MKWAPQIRLRTIFLLILCAAVGLATVADPLGALEPAIATAMVIGLLQQVSILCRWNSRGLGQNSIAFAHRFAITWRLTVAGTLVCFVCFGIIDGNGLLTLSIENRVTVYYQIVWPLQPVCMTIILCSSIVRLQPRMLSGDRGNWQGAILWLTAIVATLVVVTHGSTIAFLSHKTFAEIEASFAAQLRRVGVYPDIREEYYLCNWIAIAATVSLIAGGYLAIHSMRRIVFAAPPKWHIIPAAFLIAASAGFCWWFYLREFKRLSPELAGAGLGASPIDWLVGVALASILISACAWRIARLNQPQAQVAADSTGSIDDGVLFETAPCILLIGIHALYMIWIIAASIVSANSALGQTSILSYVSALWYPATLLGFAEGIAGLQLCVTWWRNRSKRPEWVLTGLSRRRFYESWLVLGVLLVVAVPTLNAFAFVTWLGPLDPRRLFGF